jgi:hypothetical protein
MPARENTIRAQSFFENVVLLEEVMKSKGKLGRS